MCRLLLAGLTALLAACSTPAPPMPDFRGWGLPGFSTPGARLDAESVDADDGARSARVRATLRVQGLPLDAAYELWALRSRRPEWNQRLPAARDAPPLRLASDGRLLDAQGQALQLTVEELRRGEAVDLVLRDQTRGRQVSRRWIPLPIEARDSGCLAGVMPGHDGYGITVYGEGFAPGAEVELRIESPDGARQLKARADAGGVLPALQWQHGIAPAWVERQRASMGPLAAADLNYCRRNSFRPEDCATGSGRAQLEVLGADRCRVRLSYDWGRPVATR